MLRKFASAAVLSVERGTKVVTHKTAHRAHFEYTPKPGYIYVRSRAISSRTNENFDTFPAEEITKGWRSFIGKPVFVNHSNHDHRQARGVIIDGALHRDIGPDGRPDVWVELLHEVDAQSYPKLARALIAGDIARTSMGTDVEYSLCSVCGNKATSPAEYCQHIPKMKGKLLYRVTASGIKEPTLVHEVCYGLRFFENSLLVEPPADPTAGVISVDSNGWGKAANLTSSSTGSLAGANIVVEGNSLDPATAAGKPPWLDGGDDGGDDDEHDYRDSSSDTDEDNDEDKNDPDNRDDSGQDDADGDSDEDKDRDKGDSNSESSDYPSGDDDDSDDADDSDNSDADADSSDGGGDGDGGDGSSGGSSSHSAALQPEGGGEHGDIWHGLWRGLQDALDAHNETDTERSERQGQMHDHLSQLYKGGKGVIDHDEAGDPYYAVDHADGWQARHYGGPYVHITHRDTHDDVHDLHPIATDTDGDGRPNLPEDWGHKHLQGALKDWHAQRGGGFEQLLPHRAKINITNRSRPNGSADESTAAKGVDQLGGSEHASVGGDERIGSVARLEHPKPQAPLVPPKKVNDMSPEEKTDWNRKLKEHGDQFAKDNPMHHRNIIDHWNEATPEEKENGKSWYADAHHTAAHIAKDTGTPMHTMAGLVANYSPQTHWASNIVSAAKVARTKKGLGGPGSGVMATERQRHVADSLLAGEHHSTAIKGQKVSAFAHLIEHGGDSQEDKDAGRSRVCVDRHAYSVACGARASDAAYGHSRLGTQKRYNEAVGHYQEAAKHISKAEGEHIEPHQVQAVTWLVRQRLNQKHDAKVIDGASRSSARAHSAAKEMSQYLGEHHPEASLQMPGTGYSKNNAPNKLEKLSFGYVPSYDLTVEAAATEAEPEWDGLLAVLGE